MTDRFRIYLCTCAIMRFVQRAKLQGLLRPIVCFKHFFPFLTLDIYWLTLLYVVYTTATAFPV